jgi:hypothetical protein
MLFKFFVALLLFALLGFLLFGVLLGRVIKFFGSSDNSKTNKRTNRSNNQHQSANTPSKKFSKNEGEYVNYEEVKDDE